MRSIRRTGGIWIVFIVIFIIFGSISADAFTEFEDCFNYDYGVIENGGCLLEDYDVQTMNLNQRAPQFPSLSIPQNISSHRSDVYVDGFPILSIDMDVPINWDGSTASLQFFRDSWHGATLNVSNTSSNFEMSNVTVSARGRGNSTWGGFGGSKRPIRFRFPANEWQAMFDSEYIGRD